MEYDRPSGTQYSTTFDAEYKAEQFNTNGTTKVAKFQANGDISSHNPISTTPTGGPPRHQIWPTPVAVESNRNLSSRSGYEPTRNPPVPQRNVDMTHKIYQSPDRLIQRSPEMRKPSETDLTMSLSSTPPKAISPRVSLPLSQVYSAVIPLVLIGLVAAVIAVLNLQLIFAITTHQINVAVVVVDKVDVAVVDEKREILADVALAFCSVSLAFSLASVFVGFLQFYFSTKILKLAPNSAIRVMLYLNQSFPLRFLVFAGFFFGTLLFAIAVVIYISMSSSTVSTVVFAVVTGVGVILCILTALHAMYAWLWGSLQLSDKEKDGTNRANHDAILSTLV